MQEEIWKDAKVLKNGELFDFTGLYEISNLGNIRSLNYNNTGQVQVLKPTPNKYGYLIVGLSKNGKQEIFFMHRIVATTFLLNDNPTEKIEVNHKDEDKTNNQVDNLEWCTKKYNINYGTRNERNAEKLKNLNYYGIKIICVETQQVFNSIREATDWLGIDYKKCKGNINKCCQGKRKTAYKYHWQYVD